MRATDRSTTSSPQHTGNCVNKPSVSSYLCVSPRPLRLCVKISVWCRLTSFPEPGTTTAKVFLIPESSYAQWRLHSGSAFVFHDDGSIPPEYLLQAVWQHQRLQRDNLSLADGRRIRILHPGFLNREGGPDFKGAVIQIENAAPITGDIEVDLQASGWKAHGHDRNPAFKNVVLHVIWGTPDSAPGSPIALSVSSKLDAPLGELAYWITSEATQALPELFRGKCSAPLRDLPEARVTELLLEAAEIRFRSKAVQLQARARQAGWEQALWEGIFRALGYKHNTWPMQCLAEHRGEWMERRIDVPRLQARLFGLSGLLPAELTRAQRSADDYLRSSWDIWWRERNEFESWVLPKNLWRFHGQRPANHPQRRLALAAHWLALGDLQERLEKWCAAPIPGRKLASSLLEALQIGPDDFWQWHWTLRSARMTKPQPLLGITRVTDLAVNVILPWLWVRAVEGRNTSLAEMIRARFYAWPPAEDNSILRLGCQRLLGNRSARNLETAAKQQGLIQITRDFCDRSDATCENCRFPELVRSAAGRSKLMTARESRTMPP